MLSLPLHCSVKENFKKDSGLDTEGEREDFFKAMYAPVLHIGPCL